MKELKKVFSYYTILHTSIKQSTKLIYPATKQVVFFINFASGCIFNSNVYLCIKIYLLMKLIVCLFVFCSLLFGCKNNELPSEHISNISVVREVSSNSNATQINKNSAAVSPSLPSKARFHIIVASHSAKEKAKAQALVTKLKDRKSVV